MSEEATRMHNEIDAMQLWGYGVSLSFNSKHYVAPWSVHITRNSTNEDDEPISVFFGGGSPECAVALAYEMVARWQNAKQYPCQDLTERLASWINSEGLENGSNTPDFILAQLLRSILNNIDTAILQRDNWYGVSLEPGRDRCGEWSELWATNNPKTIHVGAELLIGKRRWVLDKLPGKQQGDDIWQFSCHDGSGGISCDRMHIFTRSEVQWLVCHGALKYNPTQNEGCPL